MKIEGSLVFKVLRGVSKANSRISTVDFRKADFWLFQGSAWQDPMRDCPEGKGAQESWLIFKDKLFKAQEQSLPTCRKRSKHGRRPAQKNKEFMTTLNVKRKVHRWWKVVMGLSRRNTDLLPEYAGLELDQSSGGAETTEGLEGLLQVHRREKKG